MVTLRDLGSSGLKIAPLVFGGNVFGWTVDETTSFALLDGFVAAGLNAIDTADVYSAWVPGHKGGESETIIGKWLKRSGKRAHVVLATKVGMKLSDDKQGLSKARILQAVDDSLTRLQTDYIDLYQSHTDDAATPLAESLGAYEVLIKQGKVRAIGASNYSAARLREAGQVSAQKHLPHYTVLQPHYNLYDRQVFEADLESVCREQRLGVIPYFALASGFLTGKYRSEADLGKSLRGGGNQKYLNDRGLKILAALDKVAKEAKTSQACVALAWLMARPSVTAPIASATNLQQLADLVAATQLQLSRDALETLDQASRWS